MGQVFFNKANYPSAYKYKAVQVRAAKPNEVIDTVLANGKKEVTGRIARDGDKIVKNINSPEQWIVNPETFNKKYEATKQNEIFKPKGNPMRFQKLKENVEIIPSNWGGTKQHMEKGDFLLQDPENTSNIYGIANKEARDTYKPVNNLVNRLKIKGRLKI